jgi:Phosphotransacetylase
LKEIGLDENYKIKIVNSTNKEKREIYTKKLYAKLQRKGLLERDVDRLIRNDRVIWGSSMVECGDADAMVTGNIRHYAASIESLKKVVEARPGEILFGLNLLITPKKTVFIADTQVNDFPSAEHLIKIATSSVRVARLFGFDPKVAFLSHSTFGKPSSRNTKHVREAIEILKKTNVDFDFDAFQHTGLAVVLQGLVRPRLRGTELEFWRNSEEARTDRPSQQLRSLNGEWRLMRYFLLTHLCGISHRIWCTLSTICSDAA